VLTTYLEVLDEGYYEAKIAFDSLADGHVWKRPAEGLLSIGEIAGHVAYWEAVKFAGEGGKPEPDLTKCRVSSLLIDRRFKYYSTNLTTLPSQEHLAMTSEEVCSELLRVHIESMAYFNALSPNLDDCPTGWPPNYSYCAFLSYAAFHIAYHTGQIYSARHLLGDETPNN
jgi:hypothetical protein